MAYLVFRFKGMELGRWALRDPVVLGRSSECDISVRDIMLSRRHCRIERRGRAWFVTDLTSKNGTFIEDGSSRLRIAQQILREGSRLRIGKTTVTFHEGKLSKAESGWRAPDKSRPFDPSASLDATVAGFEFSRPSKLRHIDRALPSPKPSPPDPASYSKDDVRGFVHELVSSSWDSIYADASRRVSPERPPPRPIICMPQRIPHRPPALPKLTFSSTKKLTPAPPTKRWEKRLRKTAFGIATIAQWMTLLSLSRLPLSPILPVRERANDSHVRASLNRCRLNQCAHRTA